jgi:hypothetical protein
VPLLVQKHAAHPALARWWDHREVALCGHAAAETYAVLTRLPGDSRLASADAALLLRERFVAHLLLGADVSERIAVVLSELGIAGGAVQAHLRRCRRPSRHHPLTGRSDRDSCPTENETPDIAVRRPVRDQP